MGTPSIVLPFFRKGENSHDFLFAFLLMQPFQKGLLFKERIFSWWSKFFPLRVDRIEAKKGSIAAFSKGVSIQFN